MNHAEKLILSDRTVDDYQVKLQYSLFINMETSCLSYSGMNNSALEYEIHTFSSVPPKNNTGHTHKTNDSKSKVHIDLNNQSINTVGQFPLRRNSTAEQGIEAGTSWSVASNSNH